MLFRTFLAASAATAFAGTVHAQAAGAADQPWTLGEAADLPDWLTVTGSFRARYESLSNHFRVGASENDQLVSYRTTLFAEARGERIRAGIEVFDSRAYGSDAGGTVGTGEVNVFEPVQAYLGIDLGESIGGGKSDLVLGRFTFDLGSRRLVGRNNFRNTTNAFTGALFTREGSSGDTLTAFYSVPQTRLPADKTSILDNEFELDEESGEILFWGAFYERPKFTGDVAAEFYIFGLNEDDSDTVQTTNRQLYTPGARFYTTPAKSAWDWEVEGTWQFGDTRASTSPADTTDLDVSAYFLHADLGYTFDAPWQPRLEVNWNYATGDDEAGDDEWNRFDSLYGPRRPDFGPTGIFGALSRVNINAPGIKLDVKPNSRWDGFVEYKGVWLADENDRFDRGRQADPLGESGSFAGHYLQFRARYWIVPKSVRLDFGAAALLEGEFLQDAPNATGNGDSTYGYADITWTF